MGIYKFTYQTLSCIATLLEIVPETLLQNVNSYELSTNSFNETLLLNGFRQLTSQGQEYILETINMAKLRYAIEDTSSYRIAAAPDVTPAKVETLKKPKHS